MSLEILVPFVLGSFAVLQAALNRQIAARWGLAPAVLLNSLVLTALALLAYLMSRPPYTFLPETFRDRGGFTQISWWYVLPGIFGFSLVLGLPWALARIGAFKVFIGLIGAQLLTSLVWDAMLENRPLSVYRVLGAVLSLISIALVNWKG